MNVNQATWKKGKKRVTGKWHYQWCADVFWVHLDGKDPVTGLRRVPFSVYGDEPEFKGWKLVKEKSQN